VLKALQYSKWASAVAAEAVGLTTNSTPRVESESLVHNVTLTWHLPLRTGFKLPHILAGFL
jgi:hypothetical protein